MSAASFPDLYKESVRLQDPLYCMCDINFHLGSECRNLVSHPEYQAVLCHWNCDCLQPIAPISLRRFKVQVLSLQLTT